VEGIHATNEPMRNSTLVWAAWLKPSFADRMGLHLLFQGEVGQAVRLQRSQDLRAWEDWVAMLATGTSQEIVDPNAVRRDQQFYRAVTP
jgi:hypothetical protein